MSSLEEHKRMAWELFKISYQSYSEGLDAETLIDCSHVWAKSFNEYFENLQSKLNE